VRKGDALLEIDPEIYVREKELRLASIRGIEANIETALAEERLKKDEYASAIAELETRLTSLDAERKNARSGRMQISSAEERVRILRISVSRAEQDAAFWEEQYGIAGALLESGAIPQLEFAEAENQYRAAESQLAQYQEELAAGESEMKNTDEKTRRVEESAEQYYDSLESATRRQILSLRENLEKNYSEYTIRYYNTQIAAETEQIRSLDADIAKCLVTAPAGGWVKELPAGDMSWLPPQTAAAVIKVVDAVKVESYVSTKDVGSIRAGDAVSVILKGRDADRSFAGRVEEVRDWAEPIPSALGIEEKKVRVTIAVPSGDAAEDPPLKPGFGVDVRYTVYRAPDQILVPNSALFQADGADYVFVSENQRVAARAVSAGAGATTETVIASGLAAGDLVVADANTEGLAEGVRIAPPITAK
jgi:multidrug resistance efflux pump